MTTVSVVSAHGFAGTVANDSTTPAITLSTTITGILKGDGTSISAAALSDFPTIATLNVVANTTAGTAAPAGVTLSALVDAAIASTQGDILYRGASAWSALAPGSSGNVLASQGASANPHWIPGYTGTNTGDQTITLTTDVTGTGTGSFATTIAAGAVTLAKQANFAGVSLMGNPTSPAATPSAITLGPGTTLQSFGGSLVGAAGVAAGGTGDTTLTAHAVLLGEGTSAVSFATIGTTGRVLTDQGGSADPAFASTGITITQHHATVATATVSAGATTLDATTNDRWNATLVNGTPTAITISGMVAGQTVRVAAIQDGTGSCTATWALSSGTLKWSGGSAPTLATGAGKIDIVVFECTSAGVVCGNMAMPNC